MLANPTGKFSGFKLRLILDEDVEDIGRTPDIMLSGFIAREEVQARCHILLKESQAGSRRLE